MSHVHVCTVLSVANSANMLLSLHDSFWKVMSAMSVEVRIFAIFKRICKIEHVELATGATLCEKGGS